MQRYWYHSCKSTFNDLTHTLLHQSQRPLAYWILATLLLCLACASRRMAREVEYRKSKRPFPPCLDEGQSERKLGPTPLLFGPAALSGVLLALLLQLSQKVSLLCDPSARRAGILFQV